MNPASVYRTQRHTAWTRVDMLLALYDAAIARITALRDDPADTKARQMAALRIILELRAGLNFNFGDLPKNVDQLLEFVQHAILEGQPELLNSALDVLATLRSGFEGIREEAVQLESAGQIPSTDDGHYVYRQA